jgi:hypothetical protein
MEELTEEFKCCDCNVDISKEKAILKKTESIGEYASGLPKTQVIYVCSLGINNCRKLRSFENSEKVAAYIQKKLEIKSLPNKRLR